MTRTNKIIINTAVGISSQLILFISTFFVRTYFLNFLGVENLGLKTLILGVTSFLNLSELGLSSSLMFSLYSYIKDKNYPAIKSILNLSSKMFKSIGVTIIIIGFFMSFFIVDFVNSDDISSRVILSVYFIQLIITGFNYFFIHKKIFISSNQLNYVVVIIETFFNVLISILNIFLLSVFKDFLLFSFISATYYILSNISINFYFNYKFKEVKNVAIDPEKKYNTLFLRNIPYSLLIKLGSFVYFFMDSIVINYYLGLAIVGLLANYQLIINSLKSFLGSFNSALVPSLGNFLSEVGDKKSVINLFKRINLLFYFLGSIISVGFALFINPFLNLWLGPTYLLSIENVILFSLVFLFEQITTSLWHFMNASGKFKNESISSIIALLTKLFLSISLVAFIGISGIFLGTIISNFVYFFNRSKFLNEYYFKFGNYQYFKHIFQGLLFTFMQYFFLSSLISFFEINSWLNFSIIVFITTMVLLLSNYFFYRKDDAFQFYFLYIKKYLLSKLNVLVVKK